jgi:hypothetical protein
MSDAQIRTLKEQIESGQIETDAAAILNHIKSNTLRSRGTSLDELTKTYMMATSTVVARLCGLEDMGLIFKRGNVEFKDRGSGRNRIFSLYHYEPNDIVQLSNRESIKQHKINKAAKSLYSRFRDDLSPTLQIELLKIIQQQLFEEIKGRINKEVDNG